MTYVNVFGKLTSLRATEIETQPPGTPRCSGGRPRVGSVGPAASEGRRVSGGK